MEWIYCHDAIPQEMPIPVWVLRRQAPEATAGYFGNIGDGLGPAFTDEHGEIIDDPYAWVARTNGQAAPDSPYRGPVYPARCPSSQEHIWASFREDADNAPHEESSVSCALCGLVVGRPAN